MSEFGPKPLIILSVILASALVLSGCAAPRPERADQNFVPDKELLGVSLAREGMDYYKRSRYIDSELKLRQALYLFPKAETTRFNLALALRAQGLTEDALEIFNQLLAAKPKSFPYLIAIAGTYYEDAQFDEAKAAYLQALTLAEDAADTVQIANLARDLSVLHFRFGQEEDARCYSQMVLTYRRDATEVARHARLLTATGSPGEAYELVSNFIDTQGAAAQVPAVLHQMAISAYALGRYDQAVEMETRALQVINTDPTLEFEVGLVRSFAELAQNTMAEEDQQKLKEQLGDGQTASLYWPPNLIESVEEFSAHEES